MICDGKDRNMVESSESPLTDCVLSDCSDMFCGGTDSDMVESSESPVTDCVLSDGGDRICNGTLWSALSLQSLTVSPLWVFQPTKMGLWLSGICFFKSFLYDCIVFRPEPLGIWFRLYDQDPLGLSGSIVFQQTQLSLWLSGIYFC